MTDLLVVGAGPAGLTAAWRAASAGRSVRVVEIAPHVGGLTASHEVAGQRVDLGSHRLHPSIAPDLLAALRGLLGDDLQTRRRHGRLRLHDRWVAFPLRAGDLARHLPPGFALDAARGVLRNRDGHNAATYADAVRARLGPRMLDDFYGPYARKLWGTAPEDLQPEVARHRISVTGPVDLARRAFAANDAPRRSFLYPRLGFGQIADALAGAATAAGAVIDLGVRIESVRPAIDHVDLVIAGRPERVDRVLWTAPPGALAATLDPGPAHLVSDLAAMRTRAMVLVYLVLDTARYSEFDAHYLPDPAVAMTRVSEPKNYRDGPDPGDRTVLCAEVPCWTDDPLYRDAETIGPDLVVDGLERSSMPPARVLEAHVRRVPGVYPVLDLASAAPRARVDAWAASIPRVTVLGRQGLGVGDNLHHVMAMGWDAGELAARGWDDGAWRDARARYRNHVVED